MKKLITILTFAFAVNAKAIDHEQCLSAVNDQLKIIDESNHLILSLDIKKDTDISAYEINGLQKNLTIRYDLLEKLSDICKDDSLGFALTIYDYAQLGKSAFKNKTLRRMILNFTRFPKYHLTELKHNYDFYTSSEIISACLEEIEIQHTVLPEAIKISEDDAFLGEFFKLSDATIKGTTSTIAGITRVWGFISDQLKWREGRLNKNKEALEILKKTLHPLDLIYEKRTFLLANYTIPGHWGHVAVWLGTKEELIKLNIWDKDVFKPFQKFVEEGKNIIEVRKPGSDAISLEDFINLDEIAVTRIKDAESRAEEIYEGMADQLEKKYDFTFNALSIDRITCAEFVAFSFGEIHWPLTKTASQVNITPDNVAILSLYENSPAEFILYFTGNKDNSLEIKNHDDWIKLFGKNAQKTLSYKN